jgi:hypothetical protein
VGDEQRALHGPGADPFHCGELPDHFLIGQLAELGLRQMAVAEALGQVQDGGGLAAGQADAAQRFRVEGDEFAGVGDAAVEAFGEAREDRHRRDHRDLLADDREDQRAEQVHRGQAADPDVGVEVGTFGDQLGEDRIGFPQPGQAGTDLLRSHCHAVLQLRSSRAGTGRAAGPLGVG